MENGDYKGVVLLLGEGIIKSKGYEFTLPENMCILHKSSFGKRRLQISKAKGLCGEKKSNDHAKKIACKRMPKKGAIIYAREIYSSNSYEPWKPAQIEVLRFLYQI